MNGLAGGEAHVTAKAPGPAEQRTAEVARMQADSCAVVLRVGMRSYGSAWPPALASGWAALASVSRSIMQGLGEVHQAATTWV